MLERIDLADGGFDLGVGFGDDLFPDGPVRPDLTALRFDHPAGGVGVPLRRFDQRFERLHLRICRHQLSFEPRQPLLVEVVDFGDQVAPVDAGVLDDSVAEADDPTFDRGLDRLRPLGRIVRDDAAGAADRLLPGRKGDDEQGDN